MARFIILTLMRAAAGALVRGLRIGELTRVRDYLEIIKRNIFSPVVIGIYLLAVALIYVNQVRDAYFVSVVITVNIIIAIVQEIRAKRILKKLELMSAPHARLLKDDGETEDVPFTSLEVGQKIMLQAGDELPADGVVLESHGLEVNESMLTGESHAIEKSPKETVYAATSVVAGAATVQVTAVGDDTKAGSISKELKRYTPELTPLQQILQRIINWMTYGAIILSALIFAVYYWSGDDPATILLTITSAAIVVIPEGLLLASSLLLAYGSLRLTQAKVLPQKLSAIEGMALLNLLCVDKTGTLTSDEITLENVVATAEMEESLVRDLAALIAQETSGGNSTGQAILRDIQPPRAQILETLAFSSARKMAGVRAEINNNQITAVMGAPEFVAKLAPLDDKVAAKIERLASEGLRVLVVATFENFQGSMKKMPEKSGTTVGLVVLRNSLRDGVRETVDFLQNNDVSIRVISGDNPKTVRYIAETAGIKNANKTITGAELAMLSPVEFKKAAYSHTIFARVLPEQKEKLIAYFRAKKLFTGMVGDGVNDALALKKADLGIAMHAGAPASRRVADLLLLDDSFTSLPLGMRLGNQIMQAVEVISVLFFHKIIYGVILLFTTMILGMTYPYAPRHITFMNIFLVTMPTIMWTLFPPNPKHRINPAHFWRDTLEAVVPIAAITGLAVAATYWILTQLHPSSPDAVATMTVLVATFFGVFLVFLTTPLLGVALDNSAKIARALYVVATVVVAALGLGLTPLRSFFTFSIPHLPMIWPAAIIIFLGASIQWRVAVRIGQKNIHP